MLLVVACYPPSGRSRVTPQRLFLATSRRDRMKKYLAIAVSLLAAAMVLAACGSDDNSSSGTSAASSSGTTASGAKGGKIAFLLPESKTARYETQDRPLFEKK